MKVIVYWFRNDLRLTDNPGWVQACRSSDYVLPMYLHRAEDRKSTSWGFERVGSHRRHFLHESLRDLKTQLNVLGTDLLEFHGNAKPVFRQLVQALSVSAIYCEQIEAPEEMDDVASLLTLGVEIRQFWQSSMLNPHDLPFEPRSMPDVFTVFRQRVEARRLKFSAPFEKPHAVPPLPSIDADIHQNILQSDMMPLIEDNTRGSAPVSQHLRSANSDEAGTTVFKGGESEALAHLDQYLSRRLPDTYKQTRNQLMGMDYSSKFSPWLSVGCLSARYVAARLLDYEREFGANDGTYWLWFELLWRDYFRFLHFKYGRRLYHRSGLSDSPRAQASSGKLQDWISGQTGEALIDAGMRELDQTGYLSNRLRQIVASYWIHDMHGDWRAGAAWFESRLIDYDVYSNQGNWLYIAGLGTDPRGGRAFNVVKQTAEHDPQGHYRKRWLSQALATVRDPIRS